MKILVVDDHALIRDALQGVMKKIKRGAIVLEASDSRQAMEILAREPDLNLVLLDLNLPDRNRRLRCGPTARDCIPLRL